MKGSFSFPSAQTERLFWEFLSRYDDLKTKQKQEHTYLFLCILLGLSLLLFPWISPAQGLVLGILLWCLLFFVIKKYLKLKEEVQHLFVNVNVLYHHFLGKLEVGFCNHQEGCNCAVNFKNYVWNRFGISFNRDSYY